MQPLSHHCGRKLFDLLGTGKQRRQREAERLVDLPCPVPADVTLAVGAILAHQKTCLDERGKMTPHSLFSHAMRSERKLDIRREDDQTVSLGQLILRIKAQKRVEHGKRSIADAKQRLCFAQRAKQFPLINRLIRFDLPGHDLVCKHAKRHRPPPEGRRYVCRVHYLLPFSRQRNSAHQHGAKNS
ncbi:hypothetical protein ABID08_005693 [Rhizobium binae]|uniref:Transposase n=1 Tax=Rhizobium binae TaxID=1138190 RepID=A0ABV2MPC2_9HYPH